MGVHSASNCILSISTIKIDELTGLALLSVYRLQHADEERLFGYAKEICPKGKEDVKKMRVLSLAPASFGVYLIHEQEINRNCFVNNSFVWICDYNEFLMPVFILLCALGILIVCLLIEKGRLALFRLLRINDIIKKMRW